MNFPRFFLMLLVLLSCLVPECAGQRRAKETNSMVTTELSGKDCKPANEPDDQDARICKGVEGYSLLVKGDKTKPEIFLLAPSGKRSAIEYWDTNDPGFRDTGYFVTWTIVNELKKTISVTFHLDIAPKPDYGVFGGYDSVARVFPGPVCIVGSVAAGSTSAMDSHGIASSPADRPCLGFNEREKQDWFRTGQRLASEGKIEEAIATLPKIEKPSERFIIYGDIASALVKAGDREGAHRLLLKGRAEALKKPYIEALEFTLMHITAGLAGAGYYDEAKADIPLYEGQQDQLGMRLTIARLQGARQDFEAAKTTYQEIIKDELERVPRRDWNLKQVCESQALLKLYDEVRNTAALIIDIDAKRSCEEQIPKQSPQP